MTDLNNPGNWQRRLAGEAIPIHDGEPDYGFYRVRTRDKTGWRAVAYWYFEGVVLCRIDGRDLDPQRANELWSYASQNPISYELYKSVTEGGAWPDLNDEVTRTNQAPADNSYEALQERIDDLAREAERLMKKGAARTEDEANQAADVANKLGELYGRADKEREREKAPHLQASREVDDKWRPLTAAASIYKRLKEMVVAPFLAAQKAEQARQEAEARRRADEAARLAREAEAEARRKAEDAARAGDAQSAQAAEKALADADARVQAEAEAHRKADAIAAATVTAGTRGRAVHLRSKIVVAIEDRDAVLGYFKDRQEITDLLQSLAEKAAKAGIAVPGVRVSKQMVAA